MYIFEINLKNSPSAPCHNKEGREQCVCLCVSSCSGGSAGGSMAGKQEKWTVEVGVIGYIFLLRVMGRKALKF